MAASDRPRCAGGDAGRSMVLTPLLCSAMSGAVTDHFALLKNSVTTRSANFTRLPGSSTWPCTRMSWNFSIAAGVGEAQRLGARDTQRAQGAVL